MEGPAGYRSVLCALMPNLSTQLHISPHEPTLSEHELREVQRFLSLNREREEEEEGKEEDAFGGDGGKGLKDPSSTGKRRALKALTTSESNIAGRIENGSLPKKQGLTLTNFLGGKENASSSSSSSSSSMSDIFQRNRLPRRERCSRITSRRRPFVADLRNLDTNASAEYQIQDVYAFWQAVEERDAAEAIVNKLKGNNQIFPESNRLKLGERRKLSQRRTSRLRGFSVELPLCTELMTEDEEQQEGSCYTPSENFQLDGVHIPASQTVDSYQSNVTSERKISDLDKERNSIRNENNILSETILSPHPHLGIPSLAIISSSHMNMNDEAYSEGKAKDCSSRCEVSEIASGSQDKMLKNMCAVGPEGMAHGDVAEVADVCDMLVVTPFVTRKKLQQKLTPYTSPTPPPNPLAGISFRDEDNRRRLNFMEEKSSPDSEVPKLPLDSDTLELEEPKMSVDTTSSHLQPMDSMDVNDSSDLESEIPVSVNLRKGEDATLSSLASSMTTENTVDERPNTEFSMATLLSKGNVQEGPLSSAGPPKKKQSRKRNQADARRNSLAGAGMQWDDGVRRSTRIRSKPLDWWKGERFLRGRIHKSLVTVIGIKYASNSPCDPKKGPKFKVESYVPEEYLKLVEFAAL